MSKALVVSIISLSMAGCAEKSVIEYSQTLYSDKSMLVPTGNKGLKGGIKRALISNGWSLSVYQGPTVTEGASGKSTQLKTYDTFNSRYRLLVDNNRDVGVACKDDLSSWTAYEISIIDNQAGTEVLSLSGRESCGKIVEELMGYLK